MSSDRGVTVVKKPAVFPVSLAEVREWCRVAINDTTEDTTLALLVAMATGAAEDLTGRAFVERTYQLTLDRFERVIALPFPPLIAVTEVAYTDLDGTNQIVSPADYEIDTVQEPGRVQPKWQKFWPVIQGLGYTFNPVRITYRAGYEAVGSPKPAPADYLPPELRVWMHSRMASFYDNRAQFVIDTRLTNVQVPRDFADGLLDGLIIGTRYF